MDPQGLDLLGVAENKVLVLTCVIRPTNAWILWDEQCGRPGRMRPRVRSGPPWGDGSWTMEGGVLGVWWNWA